MLKKLSFTLILSLFTAITHAASEPGASRSSALIYAQALSEALSDPQLRLIDFRDATLPGGYIPGAIKLKHSAVMENRNGRKRMLVDQDSFAKALSLAGINNSDHLVIYDEGHGLWAARLWWSLKSYGHENVRILDGGLDAWKRAGLTTQLTPQNLPSSEYQPQFLDRNYVADITDVQDALINQQGQLLDARGEKDTQKGIIPGAKIIEWSETKNADGTFKTTAELQQLFATRGLNPAQPVIVYCNSGIKASLNTFVLRELAGFKQVQNYDGSMIDYHLQQKALAAH